MEYKLAGLPILVDCVLSAPHLQSFFSSANNFFTMFFLRAGATLVYALALFQVASATYINYTIDDTTGDIRTGALPQYTSTSTNSTWFSNVECVPNVSNLCPKALTNSSSVFNMTWHASWGPSNMTLNFNGMWRFALTGWSTSHVSN